MADTETPSSWRVASLAGVVVPTAIGMAAASGGMARWLVGAAIAVVVGFVAPIVRASRRPPVGPDPTPLDPAAPPPSVTVLIAARDEAAVLPNLIRDLAAQDHRDAAGGPRFEVLLVDDRSTDGTAEATLVAAREAGIAAVTRVVRRVGDDLPDGKGAALTAAPPEDCAGDVVIVLDADARIGPSFVSRIAAYVAAGLTAVTARRRILHAGSSMLAGAQADEQAQDGELQLGRWAMGGCSEFRGNGISIRRDALAAVGGWRAEALTEDIDLASRLAARLGVTVGWAVDAEVWEEPVQTWGALWRQRLRWAEGGVRRILEHGPEVLASRSLSGTAKLDFAAYGLQLLAPGLIVGSCIGAAASRRPMVAGALVATYLAAGGILAFDALRWELDERGDPPPTTARLGRGLRGALFGAVWLGAIPAAMLRLAFRRGAVRYDKMSHVGDQALRPAGER